MDDLATLTELIKVIVLERQVDWLDDCACPEPPGLDRPFKDLDPVLACFQSDLSLTVPILYLCYFNELYG